MSKVINLRKGLDLNLEGTAENIVSNIEGKITDVAICPDDFTGCVPRVVVKEGDNVKIGTPIFVDKRNEAQMITATVSGKVLSVERGERRKLLSVRIENDGEYSAIDFSKFDIAKLTSEKVVDLLNASGISEFIRQRPYDIVPDTRITPRDIFVSAFSKMPLASDFGIVSKGREEFFSAGIEAFAKIAPVHIGISPEQNDSFISKINCADINIFKGPNPSGNVGVQINNTYPVNKGDIVWTIGAEEVIFFGKLLLTGRLDFTRRIALAGAEVKEPQYYNIVIGSRLTPLLEGKLKHTEHIRVINGNPLVGKKAASDGYLSAKSTEVTVIPEGDDVNELLGWISPRLNEFSTSHSYLSWLFPKKKYNLDARIKGGERHIIMSGEYDRVFPMDIYAGYLVKAIIAKDIDHMEELGIYEVAPEDFAVAEFVDSSKLELQRIVREGLDYLRSEMS